MFHFYYFFLNKINPLAEIATNSNPNPLTRGESPVFGNIADELSVLTISSGVSGVPGISGFSGSIGVLGLLGTAGFSGSLVFLE